MEIGTDFSLRCMEGKQFLSCAEEGLALPITPGRPDLHALLGNLRKSTMAEKGPASAFGKIDLYIGGHEALSNDIHAVAGRLNGFAAGPNFEVHKDAWSL